MKIIDIVGVICTIVILYITFEHTTLYVFPTLSMDIKVFGAIAGLILFFVLSIKTLFWLDKHHYINL